MASVRWIVSILSILVSFGLLVILIGQYQVSIMLHKNVEKLQRESEKLDNQLKNKGLFKVSEEKLVLEGTKALADLEALMAKLGPEMEKKKTENEACQAEKKTKADELASAEKERADSEVSFKAESDSWNQEINTLKEQLTAYRPICDHVKRDPLVLKLCGKSAEPSPEDNAAVTTQALKDVTAQPVQ